MFQAVWNGAVLAESDQTVKLEGNHYFPPESLRREHVAPTSTTSVCPWKGTASCRLRQIRRACHARMRWT